jgi:peroxiredoxin
MLKFSCIIFLSLFGCQASFTIKPNSLPKKIDLKSVELKAIDGHSYRLEDIYQKHKATVVIFWQTHCPCVMRYQNRVNKLYERYAQESVAFLHVSSNSNESFLEVKTEYKKRSIPLPLLRDEGGILAHTVGAKTTPSAAIINQTGEIIFLGWIDNERYENEKGRIAYLEDALVKLINNLLPTISTSPMFGCAIR